MWSPALQKDSSVVEIAAAPDGRAARALDRRDRHGIIRCFKAGHAPPIVSVVVPCRNRLAVRLFLQAEAASGAIGTVGQDLTRSAPAFNATSIDGLSALPACGGPKSVAANLTHPKA